MTIVIAPGTFLLNEPRIGDNRAERFVQVGVAGMLSSMVDDYGMRFRESAPPSCQSRPGFAASSLLSLSVHGRVIFVVPPLLKLDFNDSGDRGFGSD